MVKISKPMGAEKVSTYYRIEFSSADQSYYREGEKELIGEWHGKLAAHKFGLVGGVDPEHYERMARGQDPHTAEQLIRHRAQVPGSPKHLEHIAAWDMTFAPGKSYSAAALVGGDDRIIQWHKEALREALDAGEAYTQARLGGNRGSLTTANWAAACFLHDTARPVGGNAPNPHLHSHVVVFNMTDAGDKIRAVQAQEWYRIQSYMSAVYQAAMANRALRGGYELEHGKNFSTQIRGFSGEYLDAISARTKEIEAEKEAKGLVGAEADERVNKRLRETKQSWDGEALRAYHKRQAAEFGQNPEELAKAARARIGLHLDSCERSHLAHRAITYAKERLQETQTVNDHFELMRDALRYALGKLRLSDVETAFERRLAQADAELVNVLHHRAGAPGRRFTTLTAKKVESETIARVLQGQGRTAPISAITRDEFRAAYRERTVNGNTITLNDSQLWMAFRAVTESNQYAIVRGAAGSGKSTALSPIAELAALSSTVGALADSGYQVRGLASTSGAAANLSAIGMESETLQAHNARGVDANTPKRLYVVDEGSLIGAGMFHQFVMSVRPEDRVIIAYDPRQHQAVEAGRIIEELEEAGVATYKLERIVRQRNTPELLRVIDDFKNGRMVEGLEKLDQQDRVFEIQNRRERFRAMAAWYAEHEDVRMIAPDNRSIAELNVAARVALRERGKLGPDVCHSQVLVGLRDVRQADKKRALTYTPGDVVRWAKKSLKGQVHSGHYTEVLSVDAERNLVTIQLGRSALTYDPAQHYGVELFGAAPRAFAVGDRLQITRPWTVAKGNKIASRTQATICALDPEGNGVLELDTGKRVEWNVSRMPHVDYAYAMTSYSMQYATAEEVLVHIDTGDSRIRTLVDRALLYVGASRGATNIQVYTDDKAVLLSEHSPVNRMAQKPYALSPAEHASLSVGAA